MTPERARFILANSNEWIGPSVEKLETPEERQEVLAFWSKMPGNTCYIDALIRIAKGIPAEFRYKGQQPFSPPVSLAPLAASRLRFSCGGTGGTSTKDKP
jgi:hypothetical protein